MRDHQWADNLWECNEGLQLPPVVSQNQVKVTTEKELF